jgi:subtilase family serine protease
LQLLEDRLTPSTFTPNQIAHAYGFDRVTFQDASHSALPGNGAGQTIALIDAFDDPNIASDLATFDSTWNLPAPPTFTKVDQNGGTNYPRANRSAAGEIALDVEYAHAMAPAANILLVEATSSTDPNLDAAVQYAASHGASVVSMSYGGSELSTETGMDSVFSHAGVTYVAATGDNGAPGGYPAFSPNVVAVGGTSLVLDSNGNYSSESGWSGSGGGLSRYESQPAYQNGVVTQSSTRRAIPDVSFVADPNPGVYEYDTYGGFGLYSVGGTSVACPIMAGLVAIVDQGRSYLSGQSSYSGTDFLTALYHLPQSDFNDITTGNNGYSAGPGYDLVTGRGTPIADRFVAGMIGSTTTGAVTATALGTSATTSVYGTSVTFTATVTSGGSPVTAGSVTFTDGSATLGTVAVNSSGQAVYSTSTIGVAGSPHTITATFTPGGAYQTSSGTTNLTVTPAPLTISADNKTKGYGQANPALTASYTGFVNGDTPASLSGTLTLTTTATLLSPSGTYPITAAGLTSTNYTIHYVDGTLTVVSGTANSITLTSSGSPSGYGQSITFTAAVTANGQPVPGVGVTFSEGSTTLGLGTTDAAGRATYTTSALGAGTHTLTATWSGSGSSGNVTQTVTPAALTITADNQTQVYGSADPVLTASYSGFVAGDTSAVVSGLLLSTPATPSSGVGSYPITASGASAANYTISYGSGTLTVTPATLTVTADNARRAVGAANPPFTASYSGFVLGQSLESSGVTGSPGLSTTASAASPAGTYPITPSLGSLAAANYTFVFVPGTLMVASAVSQTAGVFDPATATWYLRNSNSAGGPDAGSFSYGVPGWLPVVGDWSGQGSFTVGVVDPATATWYLRNSNTAGAPDAGVFQFGLPGWIPVVGDWTGSGHTGIGMFDPATATWYLRNEASGGTPDAGVFSYGAPGWIPVTGDWDGNGTTTVGVFDPASATWYLRNSNSAGVPDAVSFSYGVGSWTPVVGDWTGSGASKVGVVDPATNTWYLRSTNTSGAPDAGTFAYGAPGWKPVAGQWNASSSSKRASQQSHTEPTSEDWAATLAAALERLREAG